MLMRSATRRGTIRKIVIATDVRTKESAMGKKMMTKMLTTKEVSERLHMGINQTRTIINRKDFPKIKISERKWLIPEDTLDEWIHKNLYKDLS